MYCHIISVFLAQLIFVQNAGIFTRGYHFTLSGEGYGKKLNSLTRMDTGDGQARGAHVRVWGGSTRTHTLRLPSLIPSNKPGGLLENLGRGSLFFKPAKELGLIRASWG